MGEGHDVTESTCDYKQEYEITRLVTPINKKTPRSLDYLATTEIDAPKIRLLNKYINNSVLHTPPSFSGDKLICRR